MFALIITDSSGETHIHPLKTDEGMRYTLGRSEECDIALPDEIHLSRCHCILSIKERQIYLQDNNSSNGIFVSSRRVEAEFMRTEREYILGKCTMVLIRTAETTEENTGFHFYDDEREEEPEMPSEAPNDEMGVATAAEQPKKSYEPENGAELAHTPTPDLLQELPAPFQTASPVPHAPRRPRCHKAEPRPLKGVHKAQVPARPKPQPRQFRTAGPQQSPTAARRLQTKGESTEPKVRYAPGVPGSILGLPCDFELQLRLLNNSASLPVGTKLHFAVTAASNCHVYLLHYDCEGTPSLLVPGVAGDDTRLFAHTEMQFPRAHGTEYELVTEFPLGRETVIAVACTDNCPFAGIWKSQVLQPHTPEDAVRTAISQCSKSRTQWSTAILQFTTGN